VEDTGVFSLVQQGLQASNTEETINTLWCEWINTCWSTHLLTAKVYLEQKPMTMALGGRNTVPSKWVVVCTGLNRIAEGILTAHESHFRSSSYDLMW